MAVDGGAVGGVALQHESGGVGGIIAVAHTQHHGVHDLLAVGAQHHQHAAAHLVGGGEGEVAILIIGDAAEGVGGQIHQFLALKVVQLLSAVGGLGLGDGGGRHRAADKGVGEEIVGDDVLNHHLFGAVRRHLIDARRLLGGVGEGGVVDVVRGEGVVRKVVVLRHRRQIQI